MTLLFFIYYFSFWSSLTQHSDTFKTWFTFSCIENRSGLPAASLPVDTVGQRADEILLRWLHDFLTHSVKLSSVVDSAIELGTGVGKFYKREKKIKKINVDNGHKTADKRQEWNEKQENTQQQTHAAQCAGSRFVSFAFPSSLRHLQKTLQIEQWAQSEQSVFIYFSSNQWRRWRRTERISVHAAATQLGGHLLTGPGRAALGPTLSNAEQPRTWSHLRHV